MKESERESKTEKESHREKHTERERSQEAKPTSFPSLRTPPGSCVLDSDPAG